MDMLQHSEKIGRQLSVLKEWMDVEQKCIPAFRMLRTNERAEQPSSLDFGSVEESVSGWVEGKAGEYLYFAVTAVIPDAWEGKRVAYRLTTDRQAKWAPCNPQVMLYVNGRAAMGMDMNHTEVLLAEKASGGAEYRLVLAVFVGDSDISFWPESRLVVLDEDTAQLYYDLKVPYDVACLLPEGSTGRLRLIDVLNETCNRLDLRRPHSEAYWASVREAENYIHENLYEAMCGESDATICCVGHTHIDVAWLWTLAVTRDKAVRSFTTVLELMRRYPEFRFISSQPQLYEFVKENAPDVYAEIRERVKEGRWEPEGGMWLEADCNLSSGEALVRQFLYGKTFFREEFGKESEILWLPDVFGYSAALPQIMKGCKVRYFMTSKISWNEYNMMPYDTFRWEGLDGTQILTHFIPTQGLVNTITERRSFGTTYSGYLAPNEVMGSWNRYQQKLLNTETLMPFGFGDGGGGPTQEELEYQRRMEQGIPGCPRTKLITAGEFFRKLEADCGDSGKLPLWVGELYLEYHRGTYTSMARNKKYNRRMEYACQNLELFGLLEQKLAGGEYPEELLHKHWKTLMLNQFHDILPGSSIKEVYEESKEQYEQALAENRQRSCEALEKVADAVDAPARTLVTFNPNSFREDALVVTELPEGIECPAVYDGDAVIPAQITGEGRMVFLAPGVPAKGYKTFTVQESQAAAADESLTVEKQRMENRFFRLELNEKGQFTSIYDKRAHREVLPEGQCGNVFMSYEDRPHNWDAWDINMYYTEKSWEIGDGAEITVIEKGPVRVGLRIRHKYLNSDIEQRVYLYADLPRIDLEHDIHWEEEHILLKLLFPTDIHANEATFDIQYGNVKRYTHANTSWDAAKFEVCMHKWMDVSEEGYGLSILNDCKYGCNVREGVIGLTLLKSATSPNPEADKEDHSFTFSLYPHKGGWREAGTVAQAYYLNNPLQTVVKKTEGGILAKEFSFVTCQEPNVVVEAVKQAEKGNGIIVRLYECCDRRTKAELRFGLPLRSAAVCNMLEEEAQPLAFEKDTLKLSFRPYEIKTLLLEF